MSLETKRQLVHMSLGFLIFLFPWLEVSDVRLLLFGLLLMSIVAVPRLPIRNHVYRPQDFSSGFATGALSYFGTLFILSYLVTLPVLAGSWALLAFGDGAATLYASHKPSQHLPWNHKKSYNGLLAFILLGWLTCFVVITLINPVMRLDGVLLATALAAVIAGVVESTSIKIDDNITVSVVGALVLTMFL